MKRKTLKGIALYNDLTRYCIDLVKVESEALENQDPIHCVNILIIYSKKIKSCNSTLKGDGNENGKKINRSNQEP